MNILYLKYAAEVAKAGSINKAAEELYVAQPNLSRAIKELEKELGITIFDRSPRGMRLTADGKRLIDRARNILFQLDELEGMFSSGGKKYIFSLSSPRASYISSAFAEFSAGLCEIERYELTFTEESARETLKSIKDGSVRLGILRFSDADEASFKALAGREDLMYENIATFPRVAVTNKRSPLANRNELCESDLVGLCEIIHSDVFSLSDDADREKNRDRRMIVRDRASALDILSANSETYVISTPVPKDVLDARELVQTDLCGGTFRDVLIYNSEHHPSSLEREFCKMLRIKAASLSGV